MNDNDFSHLWAYIKFPSIQNLFEEFIATI